MSKRHFENLAQKMRNIFPPKRSEQRNTHSVSFEELIDAEGDPELAARIIELDQIATDLANGDIPITPELIEATAQYVGDLAGAMIQEGIESGRILR